MNVQIGQKIKEVRKSARMTLKELAESTGLSISYLSLLERGMNKPTVESLNIVCNALDIALPDLITEANNTDIVVRADRRRVIFSGHGFIYETATSGKDSLSCIVMTVSDSETHYSQPHISDEIGYVVSGSIVYNVNGVDHKVSAGDCIYIHARSPHNYRKVSKEDSVTVWFSTTKSANDGIGQKKK